jgi:hypothetical protein
MKVEGWKNALASEHDAPVHPEEVDRSIPNSRVSDWEVAGRGIETALQVCEVWAERSAHASGSSGWTSIRSGIDAIDGLIARYVIAIYRHLAVHNLECADESLDDLLAALPTSTSLEVSPFDPRSWEGILGSLDYRSSNCPSRNVLTLETTQLGEVGVQKIRRLLELDRLQRTIVLIGLRDYRSPNLPAALKELTDSPLATNLIVCTAKIEVPRRPSKTASHRFPASLLPRLPKLSNTGVYAVAAELARNQDDVFRQDSVSLDVTARSLRELGWQVVRLGHALLLSRA